MTFDALEKLTDARQRISRLTQALEVAERALETFPDFKNAVKALAEIKRLRNEQ